MWISVLLFMLLVITTTCSLSNGTKVVKPSTSTPQNIRTEKESLQRYGATTTTRPVMTERNAVNKTVFTPGKHEVCSSIQCPQVERPVCVRLVGRAGNSVYVMMVNKCEMNYIKCHTGLEGVVVPMKNCDHNLLKTKGKKRSKRGVKDVVPRKLIGAKIVKTLGAPPSDDDWANGVDGIDGSAAQSGADQGDQREYVNQGEYTEDQGDYSWNQGQNTGDQVENNGDQGQNTDDQVYVDEGHNYDNQRQYSEEQTEYDNQGQNQEDEEVFVEEDQNIGFQDEYGSGQGQYSGDQEENLGGQGQYVDLENYLEQSQITGVQKDYAMDEELAYQSDQDLHWTEDYNYKQVLEAHMPKDTFTDPIYDDDVDKQQYNGDCPVVCPVRDVMVCARCQHGVYRTFLTVCHLRMFNCLHSEETLTLMSREPCLLSAPFLSDDASEPQGRLQEPQDDDRVLRYLRCNQLSQGSREADPRCYWLSEQYKTDDTKNLILKLQDDY